MGTATNTEVIEQFVAAHRAHDLDGLVSLLTDDVTIQSAAGADMPPAKGRDEARQHWQVLYNSFPDMRMDLVDVVADGDTLFAELSHGGTMEGPMGPRQPTGQSYRLTGAFRFDFADGKIQSILSYWDTGAMAKQLGLAG